MTNVTFDYPDINQAFIGAKKKTDPCSLYISQLRETGLYHNTQYATKLSEYLDADNKKPLIEIEHDELKSFLSNWSKLHDTNVTLKVREKDWIGYNAKIRLYQLEGRGLETIRDLLGFKLILCTKYPDTEQSHQLAYQLMNDVLEFFALKRHCLLLNAEEKSGKPLNPLTKMAKKIFVYPKNEIKPEFANKVKNYLAIPKDDGYQGLHGYIETPSKLILEIQVHTTATEHHASLLHQTYKDGRYANIKFNIDFSKIDIPGIVFDEKGELLYDGIGLFKSDFDLFNRV